MIEWDTCLGEIFLGRKMEDGTIRRADGTPVILQEKNNARPASQERVDSFISNGKWTFKTYNLEELKVVRCIRGANNGRLMKARIPEELQGVARQMLAEGKLAETLFGEWPAYKLAAGGSN